MRLPGVPLPFRFGYTSTRGRRTCVSSFADCARQPIVVRAKTGRKSVTLTGSLLARYGTCTAMVTVTDCPESSVNTPVGLITGAGHDWVGVDRSEAPMVMPLVGIAVLLYSSVCVYKTATTP